MALAEVSSLVDVSFITALWGSIGLLGFCGWGWPTVMLRCQVPVGVHDKVPSRLPQHATRLHPRLPAPAVLRMLAYAGSHPASSWLCHPSCLSRSERCLALVRSLWFLWMGHCLIWVPL